MGEGAEVAVNCYVNSSEEDLDYGADEDGKRDGIVVDLLADADG